MQPHPLTNFYIKNIIKTTLNLEAFFQERTYLNKVWGIFNKS